MKDWIAIVDDDLTTLRTASKILSGEDMKVSALKSGEELLGFLERNRPDLLLLDVHMPGMDGFEAIAEVRSKSAFADLPVIFLTGDSDSEVESRGLAVGAMDFLTKPFAPDVLLLRVRHTIDLVRFQKKLEKAAETDQLTGLLNKISVQGEISGVARHTRGVLMMIDLDSFKLINDLYGHNMGDKILAQFADILKGEIRASDIAGRIGGDEFIVFCSNITDISVIEQKCRRINLQLLTYARNILGDNFNVPLGASMGAVKAPEEGRDFLTLYQKADNALYQAKQAGAHGCVFYNKTIGGTAESAPDEHNATLQILRERGPADSALILPFEQFRLMYQVLARLASNYTTENYLLAFTVSLRSDCVDADEVMECFCKNVSHSLRSSDIVTRHGSLSAMVLLLRTDQIDSRSVAERIMRKWNDCGHGADCELSYEIDPIQ